jgi:hypothetical protein
MYPSWSNVALDRDAGPCMFLASVQVYRMEPFTGIQSAPRTSA